MPRDRPVVIARTRRHGAGVPRRSPDGRRRHLRRRAQRSTRFVGLLATNAYRVSVLDIPGVGEAVADALDLSEARMHSHTGRATRTVLENLPRELVLEQEPTAVARLVAAIVGLQERQLVRVFEVPEPVGPWITVLVYLPRNRFTAELPERIADAVATAYGADRRTFEPLPRRQLAGPHRGERAPPGRRRAGRPGRPSSGSSTSCRRRGRTGCGPRSWPTSARRRRTILFDRVGSHAPAAYRAGGAAGAGRPRRAADRRAARRATTS